MLADSGAAALLADRTIAGALPETTAPTLWRDDWEAGTAGTHNAGPVHIGQIACVIYTSGSTGRPKGTVSRTARSSPSSSPGPAATSSPATG